MNDAREVAPVSAQDLGLYIHFPYCLRICPYCDFNVYAGPFDSEEYADAIIGEMTARAQKFKSHGKLRSIYFGGGTPSLWSTDAVSRVIRRAGELFQEGENVEITLECNPEKLSQTYLENVRSIGINRISLGSQSLVPSELIKLGRAHRADETLTAISRAHDLGFTISVDVIFGSPNQTKDLLEETLAGLVNQPIDHISSYALTIEANTVFDRQRLLGRFEPMSEDEQGDRMAELCQYLRQAGFEHYEVSAFGRGGHRAIHNSLYWVGAPYLGLGAGAHSFLPARDGEQAERRETIRNPDSYISSARKQEFPAEFEVFLTDSARLTEALMVGTRVKWGLDLADLPWGGETSVKISKLGHEIEALAASGLLVRQGSKIWPTENGLKFADTIARKLVMKATELVG